MKAGKSQLIGAALFVALSLLIPASGTAEGLNAPSEIAMEQARRARAILESRCASCHGGSVYGPSANEGKFDFVLSASNLIEHESKYIVPGKPEASYLLQRVVNEEMPPDSPVPPEEIELLRAWIANGAIDSAPRKQASFINNENVELAIFNDLQSTNKNERKFMRYFTLANLHNAHSSKEEMDLNREGFIKLLNSLSWAPEPYVPELIGRTQVIYRVDLRKIGWGLGTWERLVAANPYGIISESMYGGPIREATKSEMAYVRADWFIANASRPPLYHNILVPFDNVRDLERHLGVDAEKNLAEGRVMRSAFNKSGVSDHNRLIERHEAKTGAYWKSYDFAGNVGRQNLLNHPLGPSPAGGNGFQHDGGEMIFNLPNGFQGYFLSDASGRRIDAGPINIVRDHTRNSAVINGISCISCHAEGIKYKQDEVRPVASVAGTKKFSEGDLKTINALYPPANEFKARILADAAVYQSALKKAKLRREGPEPVAASAAAFESEVTLTKAAAELGIPQDDLEEKIRSSAPLTERFAPLLLGGGSIKRDQFIAIFKESLVELKLGVPVGAESAQAEAAQPGNKLAPGEVCGISHVDRQERIKDCQEQYGMDPRFSVRGWKLMSLDAGRAMTWYEEGSGLLWNFDLGARVLSDMDEESFLPCQMFVPREAVLATRRGLGVTRIPTVEQVEQAAMNDLAELPGLKAFPYFTLLRVGTNLEKVATYSPKINGIKYPMDKMSSEAILRETSIAFCVDEFSAPDPERSSSDISKKPRACAPAPGCK